MVSNIPKSTHNAAKIYYRILQDGRKVSERFQNSQLVKYLASIPQEKIDESFNPFKIKDKWTKFFRGGNSKLEIDNERALKNGMTQDMLEFIKDNKHTFNDKQLLKALYLLNSNNIFFNILLRVQIF